MSELRIRGYDWRWWLTLFVLILLPSLVGAWLLVAVSNRLVDPTPLRGGVRITEDDPRWDCRVMGNLMCGPE